MLLGSFYITMTAQNFACSFLFQSFNRPSKGERMSSSASTQNSTAGSISSQSVRGKTDIAWGHVTERVDGDGKKILSCLHCGKIIRGGGISRMKKHLAGVKGDVGKCLKVPYDVSYQMKEALKQIEVKNKEKQDNRKHKSPYGATLHEFEGDRFEEECEEVSLSPSRMNLNEGDGSSGGKSKIPCTSNKRGRPAGVSGYFAARTTPGSQPSIRSVLAGKEAVMRAKMAIARFFYDACLPMNAINSIYFQPMLDAVAAVGPGFKQPSYTDIRIHLLRDARKEVQLLVDSYRSTWEEVGCTLMADGWTDTCHRSLINFLVYCPKGVCFLKSVDASDMVKDAFTLFKLFEEMVIWVGPTNIVHIVTDNGANFKAAGRMLSEVYGNISWSPCAAHCLNLILKDIAELDNIMHLAKRASEVTKFVYNHTILIAWLRKREGWREIVRPGATRFATTFIALRSLHKRKHDLQAMVTDRFFVESRYARTNKGKNVINIVLHNEFWNDMGHISKVVDPLMRLLRIVDSDERPAIGYVYDGMYRAKKAIKKLFKHQKRLYEPYTSIIKLRWDKLLRKDIHAAAYYLNPAFQYDRTNFCRKPEVMSGFLDVIDSKASAFMLNKTQLADESAIFREREQSFSRELALQTSKTTRPDEWWRMYGYSTPHLQKFAIKILSQTSTSSGCERNWSVFERIHTKRRNRLEHQRLNDLVFIHYNLRLKNRLCYKKIGSDPIDYESIDKTDFWVVDDEQEDNALNFDELEQQQSLYEEGSIPIGIGPSHYDSEDGGDDGDDTVADDVV